MDYYEQILTLRDPNLDKVQRGYQFENLIREIQPWDQRPPIVFSPESEQLDGVFIYKSIAFIVESKAVDKNITPGSREWEDYELKIRRRNGKGVIGLFCSLNNVTDNLLKRADSLNEQGLYNIVIHGRNWDQLNAEKFEFCHFLDFMLLNSRINFKSSVKTLRAVKKWHFDNNFINDSFSKICEKHSSFFIRRFRHKFHEKIYINRGVTKLIETSINLFKPSNLKKSKNNSIEQILLLRDTSGSGKTTFAIDNLLNSDIAFSFGSAANQIEIDVFLDELVKNIQFLKSGIMELIAVDKPLVYIIDSLDEVLKLNHPQKRKEIKSLLWKIEQLNDEAQNIGLIRFPILILFTVREDYWRDWDESFDGRDVRYIKNRLSSFSENEFSEALKKYSSTYHFNIENKISEKTKTTLSIPVNLEIFSEVNSYCGDITILEIWEGEMLAKFFEKKYYDILSKHSINGLTEPVFIDILSRIANQKVLDRNLVSEKSKIVDLINRVHPYLKPYTPDVIKLLHSEQIFSNYLESNKSFRFKYTRFVEYLIALFIIEKINKNSDLSILDDFIQNIFDSQIVDIHTILKNIRHICRKKYQRIGKEITNYYQTSQVYLNNYLPKLRGAIAQGEKTNPNDIKDLIGKTYSQNPQINWDMFFIVSAKNNKQSKDKIKSSFSVAWEVNSGPMYSSKRWKLIDKLSSLDMLVDEVILNILLKDSSAKDWEVYLGKVLEMSSQRRDDFYELWQQIDGDIIFKKIIKRIPHEWEYVSKLLEIVLMNQHYIIGDYFNNLPSEDDYIIFEKKRHFHVDENKKDQIDTYINNLLELLKKENHSESHFNDFSYYFNGYSSNELDYLREEFKDKIEKPFKKYEQPFFHYLIANYNFYERFINSILNNKLIELTHINPPKTKITLLYILVNSQIHDRYQLYTLLNYIYKKGYKKNEVDDKLFSSKPDLISDNYFIIESYYKVDNAFLSSKISELDRIIFTLFSIINNTVIGFKFTSLIQVANNALEHYLEYSELIIHAMKIYEVYDELIKRNSFKKKIDNLKSTKQNDANSDILKLIFPQLF